MKWWKIVGIVGVLLAATIFATWMMYGGESGDHEIVGRVYGVAEDVNFETWSFSVNGMVIFLRGRYDCAGIVFYSEDMLQKIEGKEVIVAYSEDLGYPVAEEIAIDNTSCVRIPGRGTH